MATPKGTADKPADIVPNEEKQKVVVTPVLTPSLSVVTDAHKDLLHPAINIRSNNNEYVLVELDKNGNEVEGSDFTVGEITYRTSFMGNANFKVKKNPQ